MASALRVAIAGTGFIGAVHARSARLAGARLVGVSASSPSRSERGRAALGAERAFDVLGGARRERRRRRGAHLHPQPPPPPARRGRAGRRQARGLREAAGDRPGRRAAARRRGRRGRHRRRGAVRLPLLPHRARGARARAHRRDGPGPARPRHLPAGLADATRRTTTGASTPPSAAPRAPSPTSDRTGATWPSSSPATASSASAPARSRRCPSACAAEHTPPSPAVNGGGEPRAVDTEDAAVMQFETDGGAVGSTVISQISPGRKNRLWLEVDGARESVTFSPGGARDAVDRPPRGRHADPARHRRDERRRRAPLLPARRAPAGLRGLLRPVRRRGARGRARRGAARRHAAVRRRPALRADRRRRL